jgi:hypothetical protein
LALEQFGAFNERPVNDPPVDENSQQQQQQDEPIELLEMRDDHDKREEPQSGELLPISLTKSLEMLVNVNGAFVQCPNPKCGFFFEKVLPQRTNSLFKKKLRVSVVMVSGTMNPPFVQ